jgi:hypothetical protein
MLIRSAWTPIHYPNAFIDTETGVLVSDAEVAEVPLTALASTEHPVTARLIVRRVRPDRAKPSTEGQNTELFPVWRHHPFLTDNDEPVAQADITHRRHAIIETVFADLIDGPPAHLPSGRFPANAAWAVCAAITHNLLRAAETLAAPALAKARGATVRRQVVTVPARPARPAHRHVLHLPTHRPGPRPGKPSGTTCSPPRPGHHHRPDPRPPPPRADRRTRPEKLARPADQPRPATEPTHSPLTKVIRATTPRIEAKDRRSWPGGEGSLPGSTEEIPRRAA